MRFLSGALRPGRGGRRGWPAGRPALVLVLAMAAAASLYGAHPLRYRPDLWRAAAQHGFDPLFLAAVVKVESGFDPLATSGEGARGLMQVMPETARWVAGRMGWQSFHEDSLYDPAVSLAVGSWYLAHLRDREFGGRLAPAVAAYNAGRDPVHLWLREGRWDGTVAGADAIPFPETRSFVRRVSRVYRVYRFLYFWVRGRPEVLAGHGSLAGGGGAAGTAASAGGGAVPGGAGVAAAPGAGVSLTAQAAKTGSSR